MKASDLKEYIREEIIEILSEEDLEETTIVGPKTDISKSPEIARNEKTDVNTVKKALNKAKETKTPIAVAESDDKDKVVAKGEGIELTQAQMDKLHKGQTIKLSNGSTLTFIKEDEDEPTDADLRKTDSVAKVASELAKVTKEMKKHLEMYKDAEGKKAKDAALKMLKKLTAEKKALEKQL